MNNFFCPACKAENDEDAAYCDQCGQHLIATEKTDEAEQGGCPACGGKVEDRGDGNGVCADCGLELAEAPSEPAPAGAVEKLTAGILRRVQAGMPIDQAVAATCHALYAPTSEQEESAPAATAAAHPCPLCGVENPETVARCSDCGLWFRAPRPTEACQRCERPAAAGGKCECGAILTLPKLLQYIEPSVRFVCKRCKQPYAVSQPKCPDCGGGFVSADRIKAYAKS